MRTIGDQATVPGRCSMTDRLQRTNVRAVLTFGAALALGVGAGFGAPGCDGGDDRSAVENQQGVTGTSSYQLIAVSVPARVQPAGNLDVSVTLKNIGNTTWDPASTAL